jgi:hypothetical protein
MEPDVADWPWLFENALPREILRALILTLRGSDEALR